MEVAQNNRNKGIGTREEVYKGLFLKTAGGLVKDDIIEKRIGNRILYISKKLSDKMKTNPNLIRNPNHVKRIHKRTINNLTRLENKTHQLGSGNGGGNSSSIDHIMTASKVQNTPTPKTQKIHFTTTDNVSVNVYYPELKGQNIKRLQADLTAELEQEELVEDQGLHNTPGNSHVLKGKTEPKPFIVEDINCINLDNLDS